MKWVLLEGSSKSDCRRLTPALLHCSDTSGISVCFGNVQDPKLLHQAQVALDQMGARYSDKIQIDTTHFVCTTPAGPTGRRVPPPPHPCPAA